MEEKEATEQAVTELNRFIKSNRLRYTIERETILRTIYSMEDKVSIEDILRQHEKMYPKIHVCRSTIYNCVKLFMSINVINEMKEKNNTVYCKVCGNPNMVELVCNKCRRSRVITITHVSELMASLGCADFQVHSHRLTLYGICAMCKLQSDI